MPTVTVIGAGISGVKAAVDLTKAGVKVVMLEGRDRLGGRIKTIHPHKENLDIHYDVGASWLHESLENELFYFSVKNNIPLYYDDGGVQFYYGGKPLEAEEKSLRVLSDFVGSAKLKAGEEATKAEEENRKASLPDLKKFSTEWASTFPLLSNYNKKVLPQLARVSELLIALPWEEIPIEASAGPAGAGRDAFVKSGYTSVFNLIYDQIDKNLFELHKETEVVSIGAKGDHTVVGTADGKTYESDYTICTIPAGLLKGIEWKADLPSTLKSTIENAHMGRLSKVIFEFDEVFWPEQLDRMFVLGDETESKGLEPGNFPAMFVAGNRIWGHPSLITIIGPPTSTHLEQTPEDAFKYLEPALKTIAVEGKAVPKPSKIIVTDWQKEKFTQGSYAAISSSEDPGEIINSYIDGAGHIRFAGEHTTLVGEGCVHGAFGSGKREAKYVLDHLKQ